MSHILREDYETRLALGVNYEDILGEDKDAAPCNGEELWANMKNHFGKPISECVGYLDNDDRCFILNQDYRDAKFLTSNSLRNKTLYKSTPWSRLINIPTTVGLLIVIMLCIGLKQPLLLIGVPFILLANFLYVYKFASKDVYLGRKTETGKIEGELVKPLTQKQKDLLHTTGQDISKALLTDQRANVEEVDSPLNVNVPQSGSSFDYIESFGQDEMATMLASTNPYMANKVQTRLEDGIIGLQGVVKEKFCCALLKVIKKDITECDVALRQIDKWMKSFSAKFEHPLTPGETEFNEKLITPEEFAELFKHVNNAIYIRRKLLNYHGALYLSRSQYITRSSSRPQDQAYQAMLDDSRNMLFAMQGAAIHIEKDIFQTTQKIFQYYTSESVQRQKNGERLESVLLLFHSKLLEIAFLDQCATFYRDAPRTSRGHKV